MLTLRLYHGRFDPDQDMDAAGFSGPTIDGVLMVRSVYGAIFIVFTSKAAAHRAFLATGWDTCLDATLIMARHDDMVMTWPPANDGPVAYYGDWHVLPDPDA